MTLTHKEEEGELFFFSSNFSEEKNNRNFLFGKNSK
jgi:hypothetical protein